MRRAVAIIIAVLFVASAVPVFADSGSASKAPVPDTSWFQKSYDKLTSWKGDLKCDWKVAPKDQIKPIDKITIFSDLQAGIQEGSAKARTMSAR